MNNMEFDPGKVLGNGIKELSRQELCELVSKLCAQIKAEAGTRAYRGGVYPDNICVDANGGVSIGLAKQGNWEGQELEFLPPELYWNGKRGSFSDVYSLGLLLYCAVKGRLPYEGECPNPQQHRMNGDDFPAPKAAGPRLGEIIEKATHFNSEERYKNVEELQIMLDGLVKNTYLNGSPSAEVIFKKHDDDLTDLERIMVGIIEKGEGDPFPEEPEAEDEPVPVLPDEAGQAPGAPAGEPEVLRVYQPSHHRRSAPMASPPAGAPSQRQPIPILTEERNPELEPVVPTRQVITPAVQYGKSAQREKKIADEVKKRRRRPAVLMLVLCAVLVVAAIILNAVLRDFGWGGRGTPNSSNVPTPDIYANLIQATVPPEEQEEDEEVTPAGPTYEVFRDDVSWTEARDKCIALGGHLAVITSEEEYNRITALAQERSVGRLWIGLHRDNGEYVSETGEEVSFYPWDVGAGEPSFVDGYDNVAEDYIMLWYNNGGWYYNDSRNDPVADYPGVYSGSIGYVCEYEPAD